MPRPFPAKRLALVALLASISGSAASGAITIKKEGERKKAPDFELKDGEKKVVRLSDYKGKVVLIDFWATWCGPCKAEIPWLIELSKRYQADGLAVIGISMDDEGWDVVKPFMEKMEITYPILMGNKRAAYLYGDVEALPVAFFVDREQRVAAIHSGAAGKKQFERVIRALLGIEKQPLDK